MSICSQRPPVLGHVRLAIVDLSPDGIQPFHDPADQIHAVVNGELYDYDRLRAQMLAETDYRFRGRSDSEIVVALYKHYGLSFLEKLRGEFSVCLYDARSQVFVAARDRYGIKPLFWSVVDGRLLVAAEAKALVPLGWKPEWDVRAIRDASWVSGAETLFRGVSKVSVLSDHANYRSTRGSHVFIGSARALLDLQGLRGDRAASVLGD